MLCMHALLKNKPFLHRKLGNTKNCSGIYILLEIPLSCNFSFLPILHNKMKGNVNKCSKTSHYNPKPHCFNQCKAFHIFYHFLLPPVMDTDCLTPRLLAFRGLSIFRSSIGTTLLFVLAAPPSVLVHWRLGKS